MGNRAYQRKLTSKNGSTQGLVSKDFSSQEILTEELMSKGIVSFASSIDSVINLYDIERFRGRSYKLNVTAIIMNSFAKLSLRS